MQNRWVFLTLHVMTLLNKLRIFFSLKRHDNVNKTKTGKEEKGKLEFIKMGECELIKYDDDYYFVK